MLEIDIVIILITRLVLISASIGINDHSIQNIAVSLWRILSLWFADCLRAVQLSLSDG